MATKDVAVFDGTGWVSISGGDGAPGDDGKDIALTEVPEGTTNSKNVVNIDDSTPGAATLKLTKNEASSDDDTTVYDVEFGVPVGIKGEKGEDGTGVNILGQLQDPPGTPVVGPPTQDNTQGHDICTDGPGAAWLDVDGNLWVWASQTGDCSEVNPPSYTNVGSIQGPQGEAGKAPTFTSDAPVTFKGCGDYTADATVATDGGTTEQPNYKISMEIPRPVKVYKVTDAGDGTPTGISDACTGDFWLVQE